MIDDPEYPVDDGESTKVTKPAHRQHVQRALNASIVIVYVPMDDAAAQADLGRRIPLLREAETTIGRSVGNVVQLDQEDVSRKHARISLVAGRWVLQDLGSRNGTAVNDVDLGPEPRVLKDGDRLHMGSTIFKFIETDRENEFHEVIYRLKVEDALTRIHNKRYFMEFLERELARASRHPGPMSLVMFDIDHFKRINDTFGHLAGDAVLRDVAANVKALVRKEQCFARYGGEEFAIVLPETGLDGARVMAEKIRSGIETQRFGFGGVNIPVTVSLGVAAWTPAMTEVASFIGAADERLYAAKHAGRNRVEST